MPNIEQALNDYIEAVRNTVWAEADANACGTSSDYAKARQTNAKEEDLREKLDRLLGLGV